MSRIRLGPMAGDVLKWAGSLGHVKFLFCGPDCPPFSHLGKGLGMKDARTRVLGWIKDTIVEHAWTKGLFGFSRA